MAEDKLGEGSALPVIRVREQAHPLLLLSLYHTIANSLQQKSSQLNNIPGTKHECAKHQVNWIGAYFFQDRLGEKNIEKMKKCKSLNYAQSEQNKEE
jgi:hypothetical protein